MQKRPNQGFEYLLALLLFVLCPILVHASSGTEGAAFLDIPVGAGPAAQGSAYSASATDAYAPIYNPAGLGFLTGPQLAAQHLIYLESIDYEFGSFVIPVGASKGIGTSIQYLGSGQIAGTDPAGTSIGDYSSHYAAYTLAYGQKIWDRVSLGAAGKIIQAKLADVSAQAFAADLGALFEVNDKLSLAATANNLGSKLTFSSQGDSLPTDFHVGAAYLLLRQLKSSFEMIHSGSGLWSERFGAEWSPLEAVSLRVGYRTDTTKELSALAGLSVGLGVKLFGQEFAYAWLPYGDLGNTQYFSLLLRFGKTEEEKRNLIQYQSIKKHRTVKSGQSTAEPGDADYQQLLQLIHDEPDRNALAPKVGTGK